VKEVAACGQGRSASGASIPCAGVAIGRPPWTANQEPAAGDTETDRRAPRGRFSRFKNKT
jgi:hypothetical protein